MPGYVYVVEAERGIKIGWTQTPHQRIAYLRRTVDRHLYVWAVVEGTREDERRLHDRYRRFNIAGEWFEAAAEIMRDCEQERLGKRSGLCRFERARAA